MNRGRLDIRFQTRFYRQVDGPVLGIRWRHLGRRLGDDRGQGTLTRSCYSITNQALMLNTDSKVASNTALAAESCPRLYIEANR